MWNWIVANGTGLNVILNLGMLAIWGVYLQLLLITYLRQRRANILITRGAGSGQNARCLVTNMSAEAIYVRSVLATVSMSGDDLTLAVTDTEESEAGDQSMALSSVSSQEIAPRPSRLRPWEDCQRGPCQPAESHASARIENPSPMRSFVSGSTRQAHFSIAAIRKKCSISIDQMTDERTFQTFAAAPKFHSAGARFWQRGRIVAIFRGCEIIDTVV